ncbi:morphogenic membrane protein MmpB [Streptacidiphilus sp. PAMC 29251]
MLWSDPVDETAQEKRRLNALLRRVGLLIALFAILILILATT